MVAAHSLALATSIAATLMTALPAQADSLPAEALPNSSPQAPLSLSCHDMVFGDFVPDREPFGMTGGNNAKPKYSVDTVWTATAPNGTTATMRTVAINNNSGKFIATGHDPDVFFIEFTDPRTGNRTPRLTEREGDPGDSWVLEVEYNRPIGSARILAGDIDSQYVNNNIRFRDILEVESFLGGTSISSTNTYVGSILVESISGNKHIFTDDSSSTDNSNSSNTQGLGPNPSEDATSSRIVVDYQNTFIDTTQITYAVGESLDGGATQAIFMTSGMAAGCHIGGNAFEDTSRDDLLSSGERGLDEVTVTLYKDDGDNILETHGDDLRIEVKETQNGGEYLFTNLAENTNYWVDIDETDGDLGGLTYGGGDAESSQINPRQATLLTTDILNINFPFDPAGNAQMALVKRITAINRGQADEQVFDDTYIDVGSPDDDDNAAEWPANYLSGVVGGISVQPGDEIEYTIYFLSNGSTVAQDFRLCDRIPDHLTFTDDAFDADTGIMLGRASGNQSLTNTEDLDIGAYIANNNDSLTYCRYDLTQGSQTQNNGFIIVNVGDVPSASIDPTGAYGFVRFKAKVN
ncbi:SdrD B-like domain-containing protein [Leptolyngbya sp. Heron Island J]|uniref:SdrD B-like domain-containing protein n=1 Tax=Leptolyngbya sp. Heron Island J TaxID=1385935 RepID=UPI0004CE71FE|nr:SdrD B-like domain-containing protein [Leptolyngbya sp. Heron Island J]